MLDEESTDLKAKQLAGNALARWENEGGAAMPGLTNSGVHVPETGGHHRP